MLQGWNSIAAFTRKSPYSLYFLPYAQVYQLGLLHFNTPISPHFLSCLLFPELSFDYEFLEYIVFENDCKLYSLLWGQFDNLNYDPFPN